MATLSVKYSFELPVIGADTDQWGNYLNANWTKLDGLLSGAAPITKADLQDAKITSADAKLTGGSLDNMDFKNGNVAALGLTIAKSVTETVQLIGGQTPALDPAHGTIIAWGPVANVVNAPVITLASGQSMLLMIVTPPNFAAGSINWNAVVWINGVPTLEAGKTTVVTLWAVGSGIYGMMAGKTA